MTSYGVGDLDACFANSRSLQGGLRMRLARQVAERELTLDNGYVTVASFG